MTAAGFGTDATGTVTMWCRGATAAGVKVVVDRFHATQDRLRINLTPVPDGQYVTKLATAIRSGDVPDIVDIDDINSMLFIFRGVFTDLTPLVEALPYRQNAQPGPPEAGHPERAHLRRSRTSRTTPCSGTTPSCSTGRGSTRRRR